MPRRIRKAAASRYAATLLVAGIGMGVLTGLSASGDIQAAIQRGRIAAFSAAPASASAPEAAESSVIRPASAAVAPADAALVEAMGYSMAAQLQIKDEAACARLEEAYRAGCRTYLDAAPAAEILPVQSVL